MSRLVLLVLATLTLVAAGCGGDEGGGAQEADQLLQRGFSTDVDSGEISMEMELQLEGLEGADGTFRLELSGPFRSRGPTKLPDADLDFSASGQGVNLEGRVVMLPENAWIEFGGETYEVGEELWSRAQGTLNSDGGPETFSDAKVKPLDWVEGAETSEGEQISGTETKKGHGPARRGCHAGRLQPVVARLGGHSAGDTRPGRRGDRPRHVRGLDRRRRHLAPGLEQNQLHGP